MTTDLASRLHQIRAIRHTAGAQLDDAASEQVVAQFNARPRANEPHGWYVPYQPADH